MRLFHLLIYYTKREYNVKKYLYRIFFKIKIKKYLVLIFIIFKDLKVSTKEKLFTLYAYKTNVCVNSECKL